MKIVGGRSRFFPTLFLLDVFFLPVAPGFPLPLSVLFLPVWLAVVGTLRSKLLVAAASISAIGAIVSLLLGYSIVDAVYQNANEAIIFTGIYLYLLLALVLFASSNISNIIPFLKGYLIFNATLALLFYVNFSTYFQIRSYWTFSGNIIEADSLTTITRFTGTMSDPNNFSIMISAVLAFILFRQERLIISNVFIILLASASIFASMSVTGIASLTIIVVLYLTQVRVSRRLLTNLFFRLLLGMVAVGAVAGVAYLMGDNLIVQLALERVRDASIDSRTSKWSEVSDLGSILRTLIVGFGGLVILDGKPFSPHNGHLHVFMSFGAISYFAFLIAAFPFPLRRINISHDFRTHLFLVVIFLGFSINVGIYEPRFAGVWAVLVGALWIEKRNRKSNVVADGHEQTHTHDLRDNELAVL